MAKFKFSDIPDLLVSDKAHDSLEIIICIPSYNETNLLATINSILACDTIDGTTEIIILINEPLDSSQSVVEKNSRTYTECLAKAIESNSAAIKIYPIYVTDIPLKKAGVGLARKLAMDEAYKRFNSVSKERGTIVCLDADTTVADNYLLEIQNFFERELKYEACSIAFSHVKDESDEAINLAISEYELHLRYFINAQRLINLPFAYQTVGSAMAVTAQAYNKQGGMNTRKAGEDFYFLHKFIKNGLVKDLNSTCVYPSPRISDRVPFGTGKAVGELIKNSLEYQTYNPKSFQCISEFVGLVSDFYEAQKLDDQIISNLDASLVSYLRQQRFLNKLKEIKQNTSNYKSFTKRFFDWYDAFRLMKCLHYLRDEKYPNIDISEAIKDLFEKLKLDLFDEPYTNLETLRTFDKTMEY